MNAELETARSTQIQSMLAELRQSISNAADNVSVFESMLQPIARNNPPKPEPASPDRQEMVPLAEELRTMFVRLSEVNERMVSLANRLEL